MYKIVMVTDKNNNVKHEWMDELKSYHPNMEGEIVSPELIDLRCCFCLAWNDNSGKMLRTSRLENYEDNGNSLKVTTKNSVYYLEKVE